MIQWVNCLILEHLWLFLTVFGKVISAADQQLSLDSKGLF